MRRTRRTKRYGTWVRRCRRKYVTLKARKRCYRRFRGRRTVRRRRY